MHITLGIIGVVAALTMPALIENHKKQVYVTQLKKSISMLQNGFKAAMAADGVDDLGDTTLWQSLPSDGLNPDNCTMDNPFIKQLGKYMNIVDAKDYNFKHKVFGTLNGNSSTDVVSAIFFADGSMLVFPIIYKTPYYAADTVEKINAIKKYGGHLHKIYSSVVRPPVDIAIDVNGIKGPNRMGRDVFPIIIGDNGIYLPGDRDTEIFAHAVGVDLLQPIYARCNSSNANGCANYLSTHGWKMDY